MIEKSGFVEKHVLVGEQRVLVGKRELVEESGFVEDCIDQKKLICRKACIGTRNACIGRKK